MDKLEIKGHSKYFFIASFIILILLSLMIIFPFITTLLGSIVIAYIFYPVYNKLFLFTKNKNISSLLVSLLILLLIIIPVIIIANSVIRESVGLFYQIRNINVGIEDLSTTVITKYFGENIEIADYIKNALSKLSVSILKQTDDFIVELPSKIVNLFVMFFMIFFLFKDGKNFVEHIKKELPLKEKYKESLIRSIDNTVYATVYGVIGAAFAQSVAAYVGFYIFQVSSPLFLGFLIFLTSILPFFGSALVWLPVVIIKIISGDNFNGIGLLIYSIIVISSIDNIIKVKIIEQGAKLHPVFSLLGVLGGLQIFGLFGVIIGPLSLALMTTFFEFYMNEKKESRNYKNKNLI